jgi:sugar O-acyltransferase (sialic acid O-acetyltransferase NeuD family)
LTVKSTRIVVLGAGGDGLVIGESVIQGRRAGQSIELFGFLDDSLKAQIVYGRPVLGALDDWSKLESDVRFVPAIQKVKDAPRRAQRVERLGIPVHRWITVIHPRAAVSSDCVIAHGAFIASHASIQPECQIGAFASLRAGAMLGHSCRVDDHAYVGPNAVMCGHTVLERGAHLGPGSILLDNKTMGEFSVAGIGAAVTKNVRAHTIVFGNPAIRVGIVK